MTDRADPPPGAISYAQWLANEIEWGGHGPCCGPPVYDWPTVLDRLWPDRRPNHAIEARLEAQLDELERQMET